MVKISPFIEGFLKIPFLVSLYIVNSYHSAVVINHNVARRTYQSIRIADRVTYSLTTLVGTRVQGP